MGWRWHDDDGDGEGDGGRGLGGVPDLAGRGGGGGGGEGAYVGTRRVVQSRCRTEEVEPGRFVRKCEKTEQLLRDCVGRPSELVESKTENTEEDVTDEMTGASRSLGFPTKEPFAFPGLRSDIEAIEKDFTGSFSSFLDEAERMTNDFIKSFGFPSTHDGDSGALPRRPVERHTEEGTVKKGKENEYSEFGSQITDV